jgi:LAS superfamily LD-carboxypeptidase LdcB
MKKVVGVLLILLVLVGCTETTVLKGTMNEKKLGLSLLAKKTFEIEKPEPDYDTAGVNPDTGLYIVDNETSMVVYVNKYRQLPEGYTPPDLIEADVLHYSPAGDNRRLLREEAARALEALFASAKNDGHALVAVSGYRSYERQRAIYESNVASKGQAHADRFSAKPGTSEHQTGLAMDVTVQGNDQVLLNQSFGETAAGRYIEEQAHTFGFIIRYPEGKEAITGYSYEPWHLRYVGEDVATEIYLNDWTLEEYFGFDYPGRER